MYAANKDESINDLKNTTQNLQDATAKTAQLVKHDLRETASMAGRKMRDMIHTASDEVVHAKDTVTTQIRTNPVQSSMIALGAGFVLGLLVRR